MPANSVIFAPFALAHAKVILMGPPGAIKSRISDSVCSLKETEHVSTSKLFGEEIDRATPMGVVCARSLAAGKPVPDEATLALFRRWYWSRKTSRGFIATGFPGNVSQARVWDEWLENRDESLTACLWLEQPREQAIAAAASRMVCPTDGAVVHPDLQELIVPGHCPRCRAKLVEDGSRAQAEVEAWFGREAGPAATVKTYYRERGLLHTIEGDQSLDDGLADIADCLGSLVTDR